MQKKCPLVGKACLEHGCEFYTHLIGQNPQTGAQEDKWGCAVNFLPILLIENAQMTRHAVSSTDKVATEVARHRATFVEALSPDARVRLMSIEPRARLEQQDNPKGA